MSNNYLYKLYYIKLILYMTCLTLFNITLAENDKNITHDGHIFYIVNRACVIYVTMIWRSLDERSRMC